MSTTISSTALYRFRAKEQATKNSIARRMMAHAIRRERRAKRSYDLAVKLSGTEGEEVRIATAALLEAIDNTFGMQIIFRGYDEACRRLRKNLRS